jgi:UDP-N-acetylglucosamine--N-acetylmuramyl-(pentapeptide) pyrophosphoryl-undecaprenol N-acetylglucosamine transferase
LRVYLAPCGIGLGHIARVQPIAEELTKRGNQVVFSTYLDGLDYARKRKLPTFAAVPLNFRVTTDGTIDFKMTAATAGLSLGIRRFLEQVTREIQFLKQFRPDVVVSDSRASSLVAARLLRIPVALILNQFRVEIIRRPTNRKLSVQDRVFFFIANIGWLFVRTAIGLVWGWSQVILIPDLPAPHTIALGNLAIPRRYNGKVKLIGPTIPRTLKKGMSEIHAKTELRFDPRRPVIYGAVSGPTVERKILAKILLRAFEEMPHRFQTVLSRGKPAGTERAHIIKGVRVFDWLENQDDYIEACDIVVSRAGHGTIMKSLTYGRPMILIPIPDHTEQIGNAQRAAQLHVAKVIDQTALNQHTLTSAVQDLTRSDSFRKHSLEISRSARKLNAVSLACNIIEKLPRRN